MREKLLNAEPITVIVGWKTMALLHILNPMFGDKKIVWIAGDKKSREKARKAFEDKLKEGWLAFKVNPEDPHKGEMLKEFDAKANKIIMTPAAGGG